MDLNETRNSHDKKYKLSKTQFKWITIIFMLAAFMQNKKMLPVLDEAELVKINQLLLTSKDTNFDEEALKGWSGQSKFLKMPKDVFFRIKSIKMFLKQN